MLGLDYRSYGGNMLIQNELQNVSDFMRDLDWRGKTSRIYWGHCIKKSGTIDSPLINVFMQWARYCNIGRVIY